MLRPSVDWTKDCGCFLPTESFNTLQLSIGPTTTTAPQHYHHHHHHSYNVNLVCDNEQHSELVIGQWMIDFIFVNNATESLKSRSLNHFILIVIPITFAFVKGRSKNKVFRTKSLIGHPPPSRASLTVRSHGTRTCIKRKKIDYGKFFDFCAEKCVYN